MWRFLRPNTGGSTTDQQQDRLIAALEEQNRLMRLQMHLPDPSRPKPTRKLTAGDVTVVTRDVIAEHQEKANAAQRQKDSPA